jgi:hypothetical protein
MKRDNKIAAALLHALQQDKQQKQQLDTQLTIG